ncbi:SDR family NAD(P)-dependent oxidoreductase [Thermaurantiacus sp.]
MAFAGRRVWITGASSGIGAALARAFGRAGAHLILSGRKVAALQAVAEAAGGEAEILPFEATDWDALPGIAARAGRVDLLINNAGISQRSLAHETDLRVYRILMDVDFFAPVRLTQLVLPGMIERGDGHIAAVASVAGKVGSPLRTGYSAAKHAIMGYFDALRTEVEHRGIRVSTIVPGFVATEIGARALTADGTPVGRTDSDIEGGIPADAAAAIILEGLASGQREIPVGGGGMDMKLLDLKREDPERLFDTMSALGRAAVESYAARFGRGAG